MIGNDIVDFGESRRECNWLRTGWVSKVLNAPERHLLEVSTDKASVIWLLWSMKEAAYKIVNRETGRHFFSPAKLECHIQRRAGALAYGTVCYAGKAYATRSLLCRHFVHTIACSESSHWQQLRTEVRQTAMPARMDRRLRFVKDTDGFPYMQDGHTGERYIATKSHHGRFEATVFLYNSVATTIPAAGC